MPNEPLDSEVNRLQNNLKELIIDTERKLCKTGILNSFSIADVESHPLYKSLGDVAEISSYADLSKFKEGTIEWDLLHIGRLTTSTVGATLGVFEARGAKYFRIPHFLVSHERALAAFKRLKEPVLFETIEQAKNLLLHDKISEGILSNDFEQYKVNCSIKMAILKKFMTEHNFSTFRKNILQDKITVQWEKATNKFRYEAILHGDYTEPEHPTDIIEARKEWGHKQEPTSRLVAINYFNAIGSVIKGTGLLASEALSDPGNSCKILAEQFKLLSQLHQNKVYLGATPDAMIYHPVSDTLEPLEMKNHAPFKSNRKGKIFISEGLFTSDFPLSYILQIQLEIFYTSFKCKSGLFMRMSATQGAILYRMFRDDEYLLMVLKQIALFQSNYVDRNKEPPFNFIDDVYYQKMREKLQDIASKTVIIKRFDHEEIQRHPLFGNTL